jgi:DNA invertase Pin-like site-specific DNA recombinase
MQIGYGRTSTIEQTAGLEAQERDLRAAGCEKLYLEQTGACGDRPELDACLEFVREGDTLVITKLDRLARSIMHLLQIVETLERKRVALRILDLNLDTSTPTGRLLLSIIGAVAEWERAAMRERQREGIAKARQAKKYKGRKPTARAKAPEVLELHAAGVGPSEIARRLGIGRSSVHRALRSARAAGAARESGDVGPA